MGANRGGGKRGVGGVGGLHILTWYRAIYSIVKIQLMYLYKYMYIYIDTYVFFHNCYVYCVCCEYIYNIFSRERTFPNILTVLSKSACRNQGQSRCSPADFHTECFSLKRKSVGNYPECEFHQWKLYEMGFVWGGSYPR